MRILLVTPEYEGLVKVGGLSDFCRAMAHALIKRGHDVRVLMPHYQAIRSVPNKVAVDSMTVPLSIWQAYPCRVNLHWDEQVPVYLLEHNALFDRPGIYDENGQAYADNPLRCALLSHAAFSFCQATGWQPDILHGSDWQGAMLPFYKRIHYAHEPFFNACRTVLTIHNGAYQGRHEMAWHEAMGIHPQYMVPQLFEDMGTLNLMKAGITLADCVVTVSPAYRDELLEPATGHGLHTLFQKRSSQLRGILNGVDNQLWNPATDPLQPYHFSDQDLSGKRRCKQTLQAELGWEVDESIPLFASIGRVASQKGFDLMLPALQQMLSNTMQVVVMGHGEPTYIEQMAALQRQYPAQFRFINDFSARATRRLLAAADFLLMPSLFEPCGLTQLYAMRYGTIPIVHSVGGLKSTITGLDTTGANRATATGYAFDAESVAALASQIARATADFQNDLTTIRRLQRNGMRCHFSWNAAAEQYEGVYRELLHLPEAEAPQAITALRRA